MRNILINLLSAIVILFVGFVITEGKFVEGIERCDKPLIKDVSEKGYKLKECDTLLKSYGVDVKNLPYEENIIVRKYKCLKGNYNFINVFFACDNNIYKVVFVPHDYEDFQREIKNINPNDDYIIKESSERYLFEDDVRFLSKEALSYAKNEILARHGFKFEYEPYCSYFKNKNWYTESSDYDGSLNEYESLNYKIIESYENRV